MYIFENKKIEFILEDLGCGNIKSYSDYSFVSASQPDGDNPQGVNIKCDQYLRYISYSRNIKPEDNKDLISLVMDVKHKNFLQAIRYLHKILKLKFSLNPEQKTEENKIDPLYLFKKIKQQNNRINVKELEILDESILLDYMPYCHINWFREGITKQAIDKFGIGFSYNQNRIIIPHRYWLDGSLVGIIGRTVNPNYKLLDMPKYCQIKPYQKGINLYGLYENFDSIKEAGYVVVYESEKSVLKRYSLGDKTGVALCCHTLTDEQIAILIGLDVEIVFCMDKDVDENEVRNMCSHFNGIRKTSYIYDRWDMLPDKTSPADMGYKVFNFMFKYRSKFNEKEVVVCD